MHPKRAYVLKFSKIAVLCFAVLFTVIIGKAIVGAGRFMKDTGITPGFALRLLFDTGSELKSTDNRTNILFMGMAGGSHDGADLTDTMLVLSINQTKNSMAFISVPRDVWSDTLKDKVNSAYHYGEEKKKGGGMIMSKAIIEDVVGLPVQYAIAVDFTGFKKVIDLVGGISVNVPQTFTDNEYPIAGKENDLCGGDPEFHCRYETLHFEAGIQHMDGERALKYVRSRHAEGDEGSDFARNKRQQDVMAALREKLVVPSSWLSIQRDIALFHALDDATDTDMTLGEFLTVGKILAQIKPDKIQKVSFAEFLDTPPLYLYDGKYVLVPKDNFTAIHSYITTQLK